MMSPLSVCTPAWARATHALPCAWSHAWAPPPPPCSTRAAAVCAVGLRPRTARFCLSFARPRTALVAVDRGPRTATPGNWFDRGPRLSRSTADRGPRSPLTPAPSSSIASSQSRRCRQAKTATCGGCIDRGPRLSRSTAVRGPRRLEKWLTADRACRGRPRTADRDGRGLRPRST